MVMYRIFNVEPVESVSQFGAAVRELVSHNVNGAKIVHRICGILALSGVPNLGFKTCRDPIERLLTVDWLRQEFVRDFHQLEEFIQITQSRLEFLGRSARKR